MPQSKVSSYTKFFLSTNLHILLQFSLLLTQHIFLTNPLISVKAMAPTSDSPHFNSLPGNRSNQKYPAPMPGYAMPAFPSQPCPSRATNWSIRSWGSRESSSTASKAPTNDSPQLNSPPENSSTQKFPRPMPGYAMPAFPAPKNDSPQLYSPPENNSTQNNVRETLGIQRESFESWFMEWITRKRGSTFITAAEERILEQLMALTRASIASKQQDILSTSHDVPTSASPAPTLAAAREKTSDAQSHQ